LPYVLCSRFGVAIAIASFAPVGASMRYTILAPIIHPLSSLWPPIVRIGC
jgi:hypothetical protein